MEMILVRHTRVALPASTCYGQLDAPLLQPADPPFDHVAAALAPGAHTVTALVSSPLQRTWQLATHLAATLARPATADPRWMELHFGTWEGRLWNHIPRSESDPWAADVHHRAPPEGETHAALTARVHAAMDDCATAHPGTVVVVTHAGAMRVAIARAQGLSLAQQWNLSLPFGGLVHLQAECRDGVPRWRMNGSPP